MTKELPGASATSSDSYVLAMLANRLLGTKFKAVHGYPGAAEVDLAVENGEAQGRGARTGPLSTPRPQWIRDGKINILNQMGMSAHADLRRVPMAIDLASRPKIVRSWRLCLQIDVTTAFARRHFPGVLHAPQRIRRHNDGPRPWLKRGNSAWKSTRFVRGMRGAGRPDHEDAGGTRSAGSPGLTAAIEPNEHTEECDGKPSKPTGLTPTFSRLGRPWAGGAGQALPTVALAQGGPDAELSRLQGQRRSWLKGGVVPTSTGRSVTSPGADANTEDGKNP
jgi:hypothetical protein